MESPNNSQKQTWVCVWKSLYCSESLLQPTKIIVIVVQKGKHNNRSWLEMKKKELRSCICHPSPWQQVDFWSWNNEWIKKAVSDGKREEQPNMDGHLLARRIVCIAVREMATKKIFFPRNLFIDLIAFAVQYVSGLCLPRSNFRTMVGSASGPGSTFKALLGSARVRVPLSNKTPLRVGSVQHIYGSLRVRVRIFGPVKTSTLCTVFWSNK